MFLHVCVSFCLNAQLLTRALHVRLFPYSVNKGGAREALPWFGITCGTLSLAWLVGNDVWPCHSCWCLVEPVAPTLCHVRIPTGCAPTGCAPMGNAPTGCAPLDCAPPALSGT